jgi:polyisoprenoid-binding protein YceI
MAERDTRTVFVQGPDVVYAARCAGFRPASVREAGMSSPTGTQVVDYVVGTWDIDPAHSDVSFTVQAWMVNRVRGRFSAFSGEIVTAREITDSTVVMHIEAASVDTGVEQRDADLRSARFFDVENHPTWTFRSTQVRAVGPGYALDGDLTIKGTTRAVTFTLEIGGFGPDAFGAIRAGFFASAIIDRHDFGVDVDTRFDTDRVAVADKIHVNLGIAAVLRGE